MDEDDHIYKFVQAKFGLVEQDSLRFGLHSEKVEYFDDQLLRFEWLISVEILRC